MDDKMAAVMERIVADIQARIDRAPDERRRLAHVMDREIVRHHFMAADLPHGPVFCGQRGFAVSAAGGGMVRAAG